MTANLFAEPLHGLYGYYLKIDLAYDIILSMGAGSSKKLIINKEATPFYTVGVVPSVHIPQKGLRLRDMGVDMIEVRVDLLGITDIPLISRFVKVLKRRYNLPLIITVRSSKEGGDPQGLFTQRKRLEVFSAMMKDASILDVELSSKRLSHRIIQMSRDSGKKVMISYHDFSRTPPQTRLLEILKRMEDIGTDLKKIALTAKKPGDTLNLLNFTWQHRERNIVTMSMGEYGIVGRLMAPFFGSLLTYVHLGRPTAKGQLSAIEWKGIRDLLYSRGLSD